MWPGMGSSSAAGQPAAPPAPPMTTPGLNKVAVISIDGDAKCEEEKSYTEHFSKRILLERLKEYYSGKYTKRYIDAMLEFYVLSGYITNLDYLDIKDKMSKE